MSVIFEAAKEVNKNIDKSKKNAGARDLQSALNDEIARTYLKTSGKSYIRKKNTLKAAWSVAIV